MVKEKSRRKSGLFFIQRVVVSQMDFCDLRCKFARWPQSEGLDGSGSCRTFQAVFCEKKQCTVHKNAPCFEKERRPDDRGSGVPG
jgi:hypothetical protein